MSSVRIFVLGGVGSGKDLASGAHKSLDGLQSGPAKHALQVILYQAYCKISRVSLLFFSFLDFSWLHRFYPRRFMSKPSLNYVSVIKCSQIRKLCRNASIISVSSLVNQ